MYQSVMAKRQGIGSSGTGFGFVLVEIKELLPERNICLGQDLQTGDQYQLGLNKRGETAWPQVGDRWIIDRSLGHWALQSKVTEHEPPEFTGYYNLMDPDVLRLMTLMKGLGLLKDATTTGVPPALPVVTGTRNRIAPTVQSVLTALDTQGVLDDQTTAETLPVGVWQVVGDPGKPAFSSPWVPYSDPVSGTYQVPRYSIDRDGFVTIEGLAKTTASISGVSVIFELPEGFRPVKGHVAPSLSSGNVLRQIEVQSSGQVRMTNVATATTISFTTLAIRFSTL